MRRVSRGPIWRASRSVLSLLVLLAMFFSTARTSMAETSEYVPEEAGHPLRIVAYLAFPVGVILDYCLMRPAYWIGKREPFSTIFGTDVINGYGTTRHEEQQE